MDTKHYDIPTPNLDEPAELEQYLHDVMVKIDATMHELDLCVDTRLPRPVVHELTRLRCDLLAVIAEVRKFGCIVRANQKAVADMLLKVKRMEIKVDAINKELEDLKILVEEITKHLEENDITLEEHTQKLTDYKRYLDRHKEQIAELRKDFEEVSTDLSELTTRVDSHDTILDEHTAELQEHQEALDAQKGQINTMNHGIGELDKRCSTVEQKVATLESCCEEANTKFETINSVIGELDNRTTQAEANIRNNTEQIRNNLLKIQEIIGAESTEGITSIKLLLEMINGCEEKITENKNDISTLDTTLSASINRLSTTVNSNTLEIENITTNIEELTGTVNANSSSIANLTQNVNTNTTEIDSITADLDQLTKTVENLSTHGGLSINYNKALTDIWLSDGTSNFKKITPLNMQLLVQNEDANNKLQVVSGSIEFQTSRYGTPFMFNTIKLKAESLRYLNNMVISINVIDSNANSAKYHWIATNMGSDNIDGMMYDEYNINLDINVPANAYVVIKIKF